MILDMLNYEVLLELCRTTKKSIVELNNKKVLKGLILDLRSNPGGLLNESVDIANLFIDKGEIIVSTKGKINSWDKEYIAKKTPMFKIFL